MGAVAHPQRCLAPVAPLSVRRLTARRITSGGHVRQSTTAWTPVRPSGELRFRGHLQVCAAAVADAGDSGKAQGWLEKQKENVNTLLTPFSDKAINAKLLALCFAQALCSVATLIHDTYLPIYLQDVLGLSNTKVWSVRNGFSKPTIMLGSALD